MLNTESQPAYNVVAADAPLSERMAFLRKVYGLLSVSIITAIFAAVMTLKDEAFLQTVAANHFVFFLLEIGAIIFAMVARKKETLGLIALFTFTILTGITVSPLVYSFQHVAAQAMMLTSVTFVGLSAYVVVTKKDFSFLGGLLTAGLLLLIVGSLLNLFFFQSFGAVYFMSVIGVFLFSGFILYDTSNILRSYPTDEYVGATLTLYLDILLLFKYLLILLGGSRD